MFGLDSSSVEVYFFTPKILACPHLNSSICPLLLYFLHLYQLTCAEIVPLPPFSLLHSALELGDRESLCLFFPLANIEKCPAYCVHA